MRKNAPFDIETEDLDAVVLLTLNRLFTSVELLALVNVLAAGVTSPVSVSETAREAYVSSTDIENGAMRRTTCCEFFPPFLLGMRAGSKSGGKYLLRTAPMMSSLKRILHER